MKSERNGRKSIEWGTGFTSKKSCRFEKLINIKLISIKLLLLLKFIPKKHIFTVVSVLSEIEIFCSAKNFEMRTNND